MTKDKAQVLKLMAESLRDDGLRDLTKFRDRLTKVLEDGDSAAVSPFEWSFETFQAAAHYDLCRTVLAWLERGATVEQVVKLLQEKVLHGARSPSRSTSPTANLMAEEELAAAARLLDNITRL